MGRNQVLVDGLSPIGAEWHLWANKMGWMMKFKSFIAILLGLVAMAGCQDKVGTLRNIPLERQQEVQALLKTGLYVVHQCQGAVIIEPTSKDAPLEVIGSGCRFLAEGSGLEAVHFYAQTGWREILGPGGQLLGYVSHDRKTRVGIDMGNNGAGRLYITQRHSGR